MRIQSLATKSADPALRIGIGLRRPHWRADDADALGLEDLVEGAGELGIAVADEETPARHLHALNWAVALVTQAMTVGALSLLYLAFRPPRSISHVLATARTDRYSQVTIVEGALYATLTRFVTPFLGPGRWMPVAIRRGQDGGW
jgi:hypothetical protein